MRHRAIKARRPHCEKKEYRLFRAGKGEGRKPQSYAARPLLSLTMIDLAMAAPHSVLVPEVMDAVMAAVMDLTAAGQTDAGALARYATSRGRAVYFDQMTR